MPWTEQTRARFFAKIDRRGDDECWPWLAATMPKGYGRFNAGDGEQGYAHRFAYALANGVELDRETKVRHSCDNPPCCNPKHLLTGTQLDNLADMHARGRGRGNTNRGQDHHHTTTTSEQEKYILAHPEVGQRELGRRLGISRTVVRRVILNARRA